jgi:hypothetical protein
MTLENKKAEADIKQETFENEAQAKRALLVGKTSGGVYVPLQVEADGTLVTSGSGGGGALDDLTDVVITSPAIGALLYYNGTEWVNFATPTGTAFAYTLQWSDSTNTLSWGITSAPATPSWQSVLAAGNTSGGRNPTLTTTDQLRFRDTATYMTSPSANNLSVIAPNLLLDISTTWTVTSAASGFGTAGFMKNTSGGVISGGNSIDISSDTNLAVTSPIVLTGDTLSHADSAVTPSTYRSVTVDQKGHVTAGTNPTIDISSDTNLAVTAPIVLTGDTLSLGTVDISSNTNLAVSAPITLTGDTLGFNFSTNNTWTGTQFWQADLTLEDSNKFFIGDNSLGGGNASFTNDQSSTGNIVLAPENGFSGSFDVQMSFVQNSSGNFLASFGATFTGAPVAPSAAADCVAIFKSTTSAAIRGMAVQAGWLGTSSSSNAINGFNAFVVTGTGATGALTATTQGGGLRNRNVARHRATNAGATVAKMSALSLVYTTDASTATVTSGVALNIEGWSIGASSTTTNAYGILFEAPTISGTLTNGYYIFIPALTGAANNYEVWLGTDAAIFFREATNLIYSSATKTLDIDADTTMNLHILGTTELKITATQIDLGSATTDSVNFIAGADGTAPTLAGAPPTFTNYYGGNTNALGDPNSWLRIKRNGTTYRIPLYT